jgi:hypothetical protein
MTPSIRHLLLISILCLIIIIIINAGIITMTYISQATNLNVQAYPPSLRGFDDVMDTNDPDGFSYIWRLLKKTQMHIRGHKARTYLSAVIKKV